MVSAVEIPQVQFLDKVMLFSTLAPLRRLPSPRCTFLLQVLLVTIHLALCSLFVFAPKMLGIMAGMDHKEFSRLSSTSFTCPMCATTGSSGARDSAGAVLGQGCPCPCCASTRAHGARDSAGAVLGQVCLLAVLCNDTCPWCFVAMVVFSAMRGSTVALGDDFLELVVLSALLGSTLDTWCCQSTWPFHRCSSWTRLPCPLCARLMPFSSCSSQWRCRSCSSSAWSSASRRCAETLVVLVVQVLMGTVVEETVELRRLHSLRNLSRGAAHQRVDELMGWLFRALHTGAGSGVVSTGTRPP